MIKKMISILILLLITELAAGKVDLVTLPSSETTQLTIYNTADLTLVRDTRKLVLNEGLNEIQFEWANTRIDPTSLSIRPLEKTGRVEVELLTYPARTKDLGRWQIRSEVEGAVPFEITYFTSGLSWRAMYMGTMDENEEKMDLTGYVRVQNHSGQDYENAQTRLIIGKINLIDEIPFLSGRKYPYGPEVEIEEGLVTRYYYRGELSKIPQLGDKPADQWFFNGGGMMGGMGGGELFDMSLRELKEVEKEGLSEYFLYTIEGTETIKDQWAKRLQSMKVGDIPVESLYKYDQDRYGANTIRFVSFANDTEHELGLNPLPEGKVELFRQVDPDKHLGFVGAQNVQYIPVGEEVELNLGASDLVKVKPILMDYKTDAYHFNKDGNVDGYDIIETWKIQIHNTRKIPAEVEITRRFDKTDVWDLRLSSEADVEYKKHDKNHARFETTLQAETEMEFEFTVRMYTGVNLEMKVKEMRKQE